MTGVTTIIPRRPKAATRADREFAQYHADNPWVYEALVEETREHVRYNLWYLTIKMIYEVVRSTRLKRTRDMNSDFKLNNNYTSRYARLIMARNPDLDGVFRTRKLRT